MRARLRHSVRIIRRRRAGLQNEPPQLGEILTPVVEIRKAAPSQNSLAGPMPFPSHGAAKSRPEFCTVLDRDIANSRSRNFVREILLRRLGFNRVMAAHEIERADQTAVAAAIAQATFHPPLAVAEKFQQQIENSDGF